MNEPKNEVKTPPEPDVVQQPISDVPEAPKVIAKNAAAELMRDEQTAAIVEQVLINKDLRSLTKAQRVKYYTDFCRSLNLNPLTQPFQLIDFDGRLQLYATKDATEQLRKINGVSIADMTHQQIGDLYVVTVKAVDKDGKTDMATGAVTIKGVSYKDKNTGKWGKRDLSGDALANAMMKAETKSKRRVTLSICGLGILDESETDTVGPHTTYRVDEELPPPPPKKASKEQVEQIEELLIRKNQNREATLKAMKITSFDKILEPVALDIIGRLHNLPDVEILDGELLADKIDPEKEAAEREARIKELAEQEARENERKAQPISELQQGQIRAWIPLLEEKGVKPEDIGFKGPGPIIVKDVTVGEYEAAAAKVKEILFG